MAITNHERVGKALELLRDGLLPFVERETKVVHGKYWITKATDTWKHELKWPDGEELPYLDAAAILRIMWDEWHAVFKKTLGHAERSLVSELRAYRNKWAHQESFSGDDTYRTLDSSARLLTAVSATEEAVELEKMKMDLLRVRFNEQMRSEQRKVAPISVESPASQTLTPWREVVSPHKDVASGGYQQAEFAADLWQVYRGEAEAEYGEPDEFFRRTYITVSLRQMIVSSLQRIAGNGGDPVINLQTNFGGGKTHAMLALYHLFSGASKADLQGIEELITQAELESIPSAHRVVLVGNKISPGNPVTKSDGTEVRTLWGELAWQLGHAAGGEKEARKAFERIRKDDEKSTNPGDILRALMDDYGPCLILIDEWVAYARQLHEENDLPGGTFDTHFTFAQALTEAARSSKRCLLVISLPASDTPASPHAVADDVEVGGERGQKALARLRNVIGRVETSWRPAGAEEGFEIVRRRLFEPLIKKEQFVGRDAVARAFYDMYRAHKDDFPPECSDPDYERRLKDAYPIHPEVFDRLYSDWSTLLNFQRTRGVLRLMAAVIYILWEAGDRNPLILPANIPINDSRVQFELTRYLSENWVPVIETDIDGQNALSRQIDRQVKDRLGKYHACRRVARTLFMGSAPTQTAANRGLEDRHIRLGCMLPEEPPGVFDDALRRMAKAATYLYQDGPRYWYSTQPTVTKLADDRADQLKRDSDAVEVQIDKRVRADLHDSGDFSRVHPLPSSSHDIPDDCDARLVVLRIDHPYSKEDDNPAELAAKEILENRGNPPRQYRNTLAFLAVDRARYQDLDEAVRRFIAWDSIVRDKDTLDLSQHQVKQAEDQRKAADSVVQARIPEAFQWLLVPVQKSPKAKLEWEVFQLRGQDGLAVRASKKLRSEELLITSLAGTRLRMELDKVPLWRKNHVSLSQLVDDFAKYPYLPRLRSPSVLLSAAADGVGLLTWEQDTFAYADSYDEKAKRYLGLQTAKNIALRDERSPALLVRSDVAKKQIEREKPETPPEPPGHPGPGTPPGGEPEPPEAKITRFYGSAKLDHQRVGRDAGRIADEVISHISSLVGAEVEITLEIQANVSEGIPEETIRIVKENCSTLRFEAHGFEEDPKGSG